MPVFNFELLYTLSIVSNVNFEHVFVGCKEKLHSFVFKHSFWKEELDYLIQYNFHVISKKLKNSMHSYSY